MKIFIASVTIVVSQILGGMGGHKPTPMAAAANTRTVTPASVSLQRGSLAVVVATVDSDASALCAGSDGTYLSLDIRISGPITSSDSRLSGNLTGHIQGVVSEVPGPNFLVGDARDDFQVRDAQGAIKLSGTAVVVANAVLPLKGLVIAKLADGSTWVSSVNGLNAFIVAEEVARQLGLGILPHVPFIVELGSPVSVNPTDPGIIQHGACPGGFDPSRLVPVQ